MTQEILRVTAVVRRSKRARRMRLLAVPNKGLTLVAPVETPQAELQAFLNQHAAWAARTLRKLGAPLDARNALPPCLPVLVELPAVPETWSVDYVAARTASRETRLTAQLRDGACRLVVEYPAGGGPDTATVFRLLKRRLRDRGRDVLPPWVEQVVRESGLPAPERIRIGVQRSIWGSRTVRGTLSLSARLLLLPPELVRHVILHELCHADHMHHRASFHRLLRKHDPLEREHCAALRKTSLHLPDWCSG